MSARPADAVRTGQPVLQADQYKNILIESLQFLVTKKRIELYTDLKILLWTKN
jgi:hypothetical protein